MTMTTTTAAATATRFPRAATSGPRPRRLLRRTGAVLAGLATIFVLSTAADLLAHASGLYPPVGQPMADRLFLLATAYRIAFGVLGCWITARLAPDRPLAHALVLGGIGTLLSIGGAVAYWDAGPHWYALAIIAISLPCAWAGARLGQRSAAAVSQQGA
jgi:hypothetical protein